MYRCNVETPQLKMGPPVPRITLWGGRILIRLDPDQVNELLPEGVAKNVCEYLGRKTEI